jgi:hypothetical protein
MIEAESAETRLTYGSRSSRSSGAEVWLTFDARAFASEESTVEVIAPEDPIVTAAFDVDPLK